MTYIIYELDKTVSCLLHSCLINYILLYCAYYNSINSIIAAGSAVSASMAHSVPMCSLNQMFGIAHPLHYCKADAGRGLIFSIIETWRGDITRTLRVASQYLQSLPSHSIQAPEINATSLRAYTFRPFLSIHTRRAAVRLIHLRAPLVLQRAGYRDPA